MSQSRMCFLSSLVLSDKLSLALQYFSQSSIYEQKYTVRELTTAQSLLLCLLYGLLQRDIGLCLSLIKVANTVPQLRSSFMTFWLRDDFFFERKDVAKAFSNLAELMDNGLVLQLPNSIVVAFCGLVRKYQLLEYYILMKDLRAQRFLQAWSSLRTENSHDQGGLITYVHDNQILVEANATLGSLERASLSENQDLSQSEDQDQILEGTVNSRERLPVSENQDLSQSEDQDQILEGTVNSRERLPVSEENSCGSLERAVRRNDPAAIQALVHSGANIDEETVSGDSMLHIAVSAGCLEAISELISLGAVVNWRNNDYVTPLRMALHLNNVAIIEILLQAGAKSDEQDNEGSTILHDLASRGNLDIINVFLRHGVLVDIQDIRGETPLFIAVSLSLFKIVKALIAYGANVNIKNRSGLYPLHIATDKHVIKLLVASGADVNKKSSGAYTPLHMAAMNNSIESAKTLILSHAIVDILNSNVETPLYVAAKYGFVDMVNLLVFSGSNVGIVVDLCRTMSSDSATRNENLTCVKILLDAGADVNNFDLNGMTALHYVSEGGYLSVAELLLDKGADVNAVTYDNCMKPGWTALHYASDKGHLQVVELLINRGANFYTRNKNCLTAFQIARNRHQISVINFLKSRGWY